VPTVACGRDRVRAYRRPSSRIDGLDLALADLGAAA
jgi:hypothetical protein